MRCGLKWIHLRPCYCHACVASAADGNPFGNEVRLLMLVMRQQTIIFITETANFLSASCGVLYYKGIVDLHSTFLQPPLYVLLRPF